MNKHVAIGNQPLRRQPKPKPQIEVVREIENIDNGNYFFEVRFPTRGPRKRTILIPRSEVKYPKKVQDKLLDKGAALYFGDEAALGEIKEALVKPPVEGRIQETARTGWHGDSFVWHGGTHGPRHGRLRFRTEDETVNQAELTDGTLEAWRSGLKTPCQSSKTLVFALAMGFAAPFLKFVSPNEGATFYIWGKTTTGKTLAKRALMSIFRRANENDLMTFDHTVTKLDEEAEAYNDLVLVLNESERLKKNPEARAEIMREIAYKIAGGVGRQRSKAAIRNNPDLKNKKWRVLCLGSGETTARTSDRKGGEEIRLVDIPVPESETGGIFNEHGPDVADRVGAGYAMAKATERTILENYGVAFEPFMEAVCSDLDATVERVKLNVSSFMERVAPGVDAKTMRLVEKFGIIYAGAVEACTFGVAPWTKKRAGVAIAHVCRLALKGIAEECTVESVIEKLRVAVQNSQSFPVIEKGQSLRPDLLGQAGGFRRSERRHFVAVWPQELENIIGGDEIAAKVLDWLVKEKILLMGGEGKRTRKVQVEGFGETNRDRWYCFWYDELIKWKSAKAASARPSDP